MGRFDFLFKAHLNKVPKQCPYTYIHPDVAKEIAKAIISTEQDRQDLICAIGEAFVDYMKIGMKAEEKERKDVTVNE